jgi:anti-sigma regulatory factor (Ser/Thr protein kinase)
LSQPPYLVTASTNGWGVSVGITADASTAVVEMTVHGQWSEHLSHQVEAGLRLCRAGLSTSFIIDLHGMRDPFGLSMRFWSAVSRQARLGPAPVWLVLCLPMATALDTRLRQLDERQPPVFATMPEARMAVARRSSPAHRLQARLPPQPTSVRAARELVTQACYGWHLAQVQDARLVVSELAANAVEHARTDFVVTVSTARDRLHLAVLDGATAFPRLNVPPPAGAGAQLGGRGRGLNLVHATAAAWGAMPARGGKVVWATLPPGSPG